MIIGVHFGIDVDLQHYATSPSVFSTPAGPDQTMEKRFCDIAFVPRPEIVLSCQAWCPGRAVPERLQKMSRRVGKAAFAVGSSLIPSCASKPVIVPFIHRPQILGRESSHHRQRWWC